MFELEHYFSYAIELIGFDNLALREHSKIHGS